MKNLAPYIFSCNFRLYTYSRISGASRGMIDSWSLVCCWVAVATTSGLVSHYSERKSRFPFYSFRSR